MFTEQYDGFCELDIGLKVVRSCTICRLCGTNRVSVDKHRVLNGINRISEDTDRMSVANTADCNTSMEIFCLRVLKPRNCLKITNLWILVI